MAWIELHQTIRKHPKTLHLASLLGLDDPDHARVKLENLWLWALDYSIHGRLTVASRPMTAQQVAQASDWHGEPTVWLRSLIEAGWVDETQGGSGGKSMELHDWEDYAGKLIEVREKDKVRKKLGRSRGRPVDIHCPSTRTVPNRTVPYPTQPDPTGHNQALADASPPARVGDSFSTRLANQWNLNCRTTKNFPISIDKGAHLIDAVIARGADQGKVEQILFNANGPGGRKIWEILDPLIPSVAKPDFMAEVRKKFLEGDGDAQE